MSRAPAGRPASPSRPIAPRAEARRGFTLLELLLVLVLFSLVAAPAYDTVIAGLRLAGSSDAREEIRLQLSRALDQLTREAATANNVDNAEDQRFQFDGDVDGDGSDENNINYQVSSGDLQRVYSGDTVTLVGDLTSLDFNYVDLNGASMSTPVAGGSRANIRVVQVTVTATQDNETISLTAAANLRNNS